MAVVYPSRFLKIAHYFQVSGHSFASRDLSIVTVSMSADESFHSNSFTFVQRHKYLKILLVDVAPSKSDCHQQGWPTCARSTFVPEATPAEFDYKNQLISHFLTVAPQLLNNNMKVLSNFKSTI
jgi:hypothetical protein